MPQKKTPNKLPNKPVGTAVGSKGKSGIKNKPVPQKGKQVTSAGSTPKSGKQPQKELSPKLTKRVWTEKDNAARKIQTKFRQFMAKQKLGVMKKEKLEYEALMDKLEKQAYCQLVEWERAEAEKERCRELQEMKQRKEKLARNKRILEAAFEGEIDEIMAVFNEVEELDNVNGVAKDAIGRATRNRHFLAVVNAEDPNGNTPLSEAAAGGQSATVRLLIDKGANLNAQGAFARTPLYRAAFSGHLDVCEVLLLHGSDPRMYASDGSTPEQVASTELLEQFFRSWDISVTEKLLDNASAVAERRQKEEKDIRETEKTQLESLLAEVQSKYDARHRELNTAYCEWNKRILEHDNCVAAGSDKTHITLQAIQLAEQNLEVVKLAAKDTEVMLIDTKAKLRDFREYNQACAAENDDLPGIKVNIRELDDVLLKDIGNKIGESGKWPIVIDSAGQATTFLRYRDTNYINTLNPNNMEPEKIRMALLGALRYGKLLVVDMMDVNMFHVVEMRLNELQENLASQILSKQILDSENYLPLTRKEDGEDYSKNKAWRTDHFKFVLITKLWQPADSLLSQFFPIRVHTPS